MIVKSLKLAPSHSMDDYEVPNVTYFLPVLPPTLRIQGWSSGLYLREMMPNFLRRASSRTSRPYSEPAPNLHKYCLTYQMDACLLNFYCDSIPQVQQYCTIHVTWVGLPFIWVNVTVCKLPHNAQFFFANFNFFAYYNISTVTSQNQSTVFITLCTKLCPKYKFYYKQVLLFLMNLLIHYL